MSESAKSDVPPLLEGPEPGGPGREQAPEQPNYDDILAYENQIRSNQTIR